MMDEALDKALEEADVDKAELSEMKTPDCDDVKSEQEEVDEAASRVVLTPKSDEEEEATGSAVSGGDDDPEWG